jgi:hypothetical protein
MTVQELKKPRATGEPVTILKERSGTLTGLLFTFFLCTLLLLGMVLNMLSHLEERIANIEGQVSAIGSMNTAPARTDK